MKTRNLFIKALLLFTLAVGPHCLFAQDALKVADLKADKSGEWHLLKTVSGTNFFYQYVSCGPVEYVQFKIENNSGNKAEVSWSFHKTVGKSMHVNTDDLKVLKILAPRSSEAGTCDGKNPDLRIFVREAGRPLSVTDISIIDIKTTIK